MPAGRLCQLGNPGYPHIDFRNFVPCRIVNDSGCGQPEYGLEFFHCCRSGRAEDAIGGNFGDGGVSPGNNSELFLHLPYLAAGGTLGQVVSGPGGRDAGDGLGGVDIHIIAVVVAQDLDRGVALVA